MVKQKRQISTDIVKAAADEPPTMFKIGKVEVRNYSVREEINLHGPGFYLNEPEGIYELWVRRGQNLLRHGFISTTYWADQSDPKMVCELFFAQWAMNTAEVLAKGIEQ